MSEDIKEFCGIIGIYGHAEAAEMAYLGLYALQHRGQEGAGIVSSDGDKVYQHVGEGLVNDVFPNSDTITKLKGNIAIGHNRYSTCGSNSSANVQPILVNSIEGPMAIGHNGNLVNAQQIRRDLQARGSIFQTTTDSEVILHLIARSNEKDLIERIKDSLRQVRGAFSIVFLMKDKLIVARDPQGVRPLAFGKLETGYVAASETCAMDLIGAEYVRDVKPGEIMVIDANGVKSEMYTPCQKSAHCIFEYVYFSRPDSRIFSDYVDKTRRKLGKRLADEHPADADIVMAVPDSSNTAALGYARKLGLKFELGLIRNHYIGRTFIQPKQTIRDFNVRLKFNPVGGILKDRRIVLVEDSIVRGTTLKILTQFIRRAGAKEVHIRVSSPPIVNPCYYGMDFPTKKELIANAMTVEEIRQYLGVDSLGYLSQEGLLESVPNNICDYCFACFGGPYPIPFDEPISKEGNECDMQEVV